MNDKLEAVLDQKRYRLTFSEDQNCLTFNALDFPSQPWMPMLPSVQKSRRCGLSSTMRQGLCR